MQRETSTAQSRLAAHGIFPHGSEQLTRFEQRMVRYFGREYMRHSLITLQPECYGTSSFRGEMTPATCRKQSIKRHYDQEFEIFKTFLDTKYLSYTMGYYGSTPTDIRAARRSLEEAQATKYRLVVERAQIEDGQRVLDIGCGFGGLSKYLLDKFPNINVAAINPSDIQAAYVVAQMKESGNTFSSHRFRLIPGFFDQLANVELGLASYDRVISLGLLEHISNMALFFEKIAQLLTPGGKSFHHCIVSVPTIPQFLESDNTMMGLFYPGAHIWPFEEPARHCNHLELVDQWFVNGLNYWRTLDDWHTRFWCSIDEIFPSRINEVQVDQWNKYFSLSKAMFAPHDGAYYGNGQYLYQV